MDTAGQMMRSLKFVNVGMDSPPVSIATSPRETKRTEVVNTVGLIEMINTYLEEDVI